MKRFYVITILFCLLIVIMYACGLSLEREQQADAQTVPYALQFD